MNPVQSLQHMLNHLARTIQTLPRLAETGQFDEPTLEAVMIFQRDFGLPVTGIVDQTTWDAVAARYYQNLFQYGTPPLLSVFPSGSYSVGESEQTAEILIVQAMITELAKMIANFESVELDGVNSGATLRNLRHLQGLSGLPVSGSLDRATWSILAALYRTFVTRRAMAHTAFLPGLEP